MNVSSRPAVQYIRMSTDRQDLSPLVQKEAIARFAEERAFHIVGSYEDEGRSGVHITNRPGLRQLVHDVTQAPCFEAILVYDVSRWGRFQDADASAYYEYHCRLHGVEVIYVAEAFGAAPASIRALLKGIKRVMAAEYSRDLAIKCRAGQARVVSIGYHMGRLPPLGYRRCSVSSDGSRRVVLDETQRKLALTDRIEWVLAPEAEVDVVRRICEAYARSKMDLWQIARVVAAEGWLTVHGSAIREGNLKALIRNEALIGNFVWGRSGQTQRRIVPAAPTRREGSVPRIVDDTTWELMQRRRRESPREDLRFLTLPSRSRESRAIAALPTSKSLELTHREHFLATRQRAHDRAHHAQEFGIALATALRAEGITAAFDRRTHSIYIWDHRIQLKLVWSDAGEWRIPRLRRQSREASLLLVPMRSEFRALNFYLFPPGSIPPSGAMLSSMSAELGPCLCATPGMLVKRVAELRPVSRARRSCN